MYEYEPLNEKLNEIRLLSFTKRGNQLDREDDEAAKVHTALNQLNLAPAVVDQTGDLLSLELAHASLDEQLDYRALSYCWGTTSQRYPILVNGKLFNINQNLYQALKKLSTLAGRSVLWVDAICINQQDKYDKNRQVPMMARIYSQAKDVLVWLGPEADGSTEALSWLNDTGRGYWEFRYRELNESKEHQSVGSQSDGNQSPQRPRDDPFLSFAASLSSRCNESLFLALLKVSQRDWWSRVWVMQEVILAKRAWVICGDCVVLWKNISYAFELAVRAASCDWGRDYEDRELLDLDGEEFEFWDGLSDISLIIAHLVSLQRYYTRSMTGTKQSDPTDGLALKDLLVPVMTGGSMDGPGNICATDPRDLVYGLLGIVCARDRAEITVNYSEEYTLADVCLEMTCLVLGRHGPRMLVFCQSSLLRVQGLPSWAIDWTTEVTTAPMSESAFVLTNETAFDTANGTNWVARKIHASLLKPAVTIKGIIIANIADLGQVFQKRASVTNLDIGNGQQLNEWLEKFAGMVDCISPSQISPAEAQQVKEMLWWVAAAGARWVYSLPTDKEKEALRRSFRVLIGDIKPPADLEPQSEAAIDWFRDETKIYWKALKADDLKPFITNGGAAGPTAGIGPKGMERGDYIVAFEGYYLPFVVRKQQDGPDTQKRTLIRYSVIGACYVLGWMEGQAIHQYGLTFEDIILV